MKKFVLGLIVGILCFSAQSANAFELSYWIRLDLNSNQNNRGYWGRPSDIPENPMPTLEEVTKTLETLVYEYKTNKVYIVYHRQFEIEKAKTVFGYWMTARNSLPEGIRPALVPTLILREYGQTDSTNWNFNDVEVRELGLWLKANINSSELGIFDVYPMTWVDRNADRQLNIIKNSSGLSLTRLGIQPDEEMSGLFDRGVEDMWSGEVAGETNTMWQSPPTNCGWESGSKILDRWLNKRTVDNRKFAYLMAIVAWDYDFLRGKSDCAQMSGPGYDLPDKNDLIPEGRLAMIEKQISNAYWAKNKPGFGDGGLSSDLLIFDDNSRVIDTENEKLLTALKAGRRYSGRWARGFDELANIYAMYNNVSRPTPVAVFGDTNGDGKVDLIDFSQWKDEYIAKIKSKADFNNDGVVDLIDFSLWKDGYLKK